MNTGTSNQNGELIFDCELVIPASSVTPIEIHNLNTSYRQQIAFGIVQVHVGYQGHNVTLSYNRTLVPNYYQTGGHLGLVIYGQPDNNNGIETVYIHNHGNEINKTAETNETERNDRGGSNGIAIMIAYMVYYRDNMVPVPGGCNLEYSMAQDAPFIILQQCNGFVQVDTPLAAAASNAGTAGSAADADVNVATDPCDTNVTKNLLYESRYLYLPSDAVLMAMSSHDYFNYIRLMLTAGAAQQNGRLVTLYGFAFFSFFRFLMDWELNYVHVNILFILNSKFYCYTYGYGIFCSEVHCD